MKDKLILISFGSLLGLLLIAICYHPLQSLYLQLALSKGQRFESVDDVRRAIVQGGFEPADTRASMSPGGPRSADLRELINPHPSDKIIYELKPNLSILFQRVMVRTNSFGMRGPEITEAKPDNTLRLAVLGDSYTFGWGVEESSAFPRVLEQELNARKASQKNVQVLNFGVPGYSTFQEVAQFIEKGHKFQPAAVLVYFIHNDFALPFFIRDLTAEDPGLLTTAFEFARMKVGHDKEKAERRMGLLNSLNAVNALFELGEFCKARGIRLFVTLHPTRHETSLKEKLWELRRARGRALLKFLSISKEYRAGISSGEIPAARLKIPGDEHPGPGAQELIGRLLADKLQGELSPTRVELELGAQASGS
jgi:hypothetical protein